MCLLCVAEQSGRWSRQSKVSALLFLLHIRRGAVSMARCYGFPWVTQLFLKRPGHWELSFSGRQQPDTHSHTHICMCIHVSNSSSVLPNTPTGWAWKAQSGSAHLCPVRCHLCSSKPLIKMQRFDCNDWFKRKSFVWPSCNWNNTEMTCAVLLAATPEPYVWTRWVV